MALVTSFGASGDGASDDTDAILHAIADGDGVLEFPRGTYRITRTIEIDLAAHGSLGIVGSHGTARLVMAAAGPALRIVGHHQGTAVPESRTPRTRVAERLPTVSALEIVGEHAEADGIELVETMQATFDRLLLTGLRHGVVLRVRNRNFLLSACHIYDNTGVGVFFDRCDLHQAILSANHISYNREAGVKALGGDLHNLQITGNDIEYNYDRRVDAADRLTGSADVWFDAVEGTASEITIASNTIQSVPSPGGANLRIAGGTMPALSALPFPGQRHGARTVSGRALAAGEPVPSITPTEPVASAIPLSARLIAVTGNVLGSQETNIDVSLADRVTITGNTLYDGLKGTLHAEECHHLLVSGNTFGWSATEDRGMQGGVLLRNCVGANLTGLVMLDDRAGNERAGGAIALVGCRDSAVSNCQILDPRWRGVTLLDCYRVRVSDNSILDRRRPPQMLAGVEIGGDSVDNLVQNNLLSRAAGDALRCPSSGDVVQGNVEVE